MIRFSRHLWSVFAVWYAVGIVLVSLSLLPPWLEWANAVFLLLSGLYASVYFWFALPRARFVIAVIFFGSIAIESIGVHTGWPFGEYRYEQDFGPMLLGVPVTIGAAWLSVMGASHAFAQRFDMPHRTLVLTPLFAVWLDLAIDPVSANLKSYWVWLESGFYYDIPTQNFIGWYGTALIFSLLLRRFEQPVEETLKRRTTWLYLMLHLLFGMTSLAGGLIGVFLVSVAAFPLYIMTRGVVESDLRRQKTRF